MYYVCDRFPHDGELNDACQRSHEKLTDIMHGLAISFTMETFTLPTGGHELTSVV